MAQDDISYMWLYITIFAVSCLVLVRSGTWLVRSLSRIAQALKWSEFFVTFCLMAFAASMPDLFVGITSAFHGRPELSFGNIIGANVAKLTFLIGIITLLGAGLVLERMVTKKDSLWTALFAFLPILMISDGSLSRADGIILLVGLGIYLSAIFREKMGKGKIFVIDFGGDITQVKLFLRDIGTFLAGLLFLLLSAEGVVWSATSLATLMKVPVFFIGILIVALGTTLPEIVFGIRAVLLKHKEMALGNLMGSVVINSTLVLGLTCLICPLTITNFSPYWAGIGWTIVAALLFYIFARTGHKITKKEGFSLLLIYILFVLTQILIK